MHGEWSDGCNSSKENSPVGSGGKAEHVCSCGSEAGVVESGGSSSVCYNVVKRKHGHPVGVG